MVIKSVKKKNFALNMLFAVLLQFATLIFPLITAPHLSLVLGVEKLGRVNFSLSVATWFGVFAAFGILAYGVKEVAKVRDDKEKLSKLFNELLVIRIVVSVLTIIVYLPVILITPRFSSEFWLFLVQGSILIFNIFSLDWFFQGVEDFGFVTIRSLIFKTISVIAIFIVITQEADYILFAAISIFALSFSNILNMFYVRKHISYNFKRLNLKQHLRSLSIFFFSSLVVSIYVIFDQILLGFFLGDNAVGLFVRARMINSIGLGIILAIGNVFLPRLNNYFITQPKRYKELLKTSLNVILLIAFPIAIGLFILAPQINYLFGAGEFEGADILLRIIAFTVVIVTVGTWIYQQRLIPMQLEKIGLIIQIIIAAVSLILNLILINVIGIIGVAIAWISAEITGSFVSLIYAYKKDRINVFNINQIKIIGAGILMGGMLFLISSLLPVNWFSIFLTIGIAGILYVLVLVIIRESTIKFAFQERKSLLKSKQLDKDVETDNQNESESSEEDNENSADKNKTLQ